MLTTVRKPPPLVTGISPKEGAPGTKVTIRGENLGVNAKDLIALRICGNDCLLSAEWSSPSKIIARTGQFKGKGDVIVVTKSGGVGSCTISFRGYIVHTGPLQESAVWVDETQTWSTVLGRNRPMSPMLSPEADDPLGISDESNEHKFPEEDLRDMFPDGSGSTAAENFVAAWFLLENHHGTSFDDLKAGLAYLKRKAVQRHEGPQAFLKSNLTTFIDCQKALADMHGKLSEDLVNSPGGGITSKLESILNQASGSANVLFDDVLGRKDKADATRNALGVLHRFKFLFNLPCTIEKNIKKEDYDLVITDYSRAKSLFGETDIQLFKKVYQEVENRIATFRDMLHDKLMTLPSTVDEQKRIVRYLMHLGTPGDPAWNCLINRKKWTCNLLNGCLEQHLIKEKAELEADPEAAVPSTRMSSQAWKSGGRSPPRVQFVELLSNMLAEQLPDLWRFGQAYFTGKLLKQSKDQPVKIPASKQTEFKKMVLEVVELYCNLVRSAFLQESPPGGIGGENKYGVWPENKRDSPASWHPVCLRHIRACVSSLSPLELPPESCEVIQHLVFDLRARCVSLLLKQAIDGVKLLPMRETWSVDEDDEKGGTTQLPMLFENLVNEALQLLQEVLVPKTGEAQLFESSEVQKETFELITHLLASFAGTMEQLAMIGNQRQETKGHKVSIQSEEISAVTGESLPPLDQRLLIMLSNCRHTRMHILVRLGDALQRYSFPEVTQIIQVVETSYSTLEEHLFQKYVEAKANPIVGSLEPNMNSGHWEWNDCPPPAGVKSYIKEAIMSLIEVHAEVQQLAPALVQALLQEIVTSVVEEVGRLIQCVPKFSVNGTLQGWLDLLVLQNAVAPYQTEGSSLSLKEACEYLPALKRTEEKVKLDELLQEFKSHMSFQLLCFYADQKEVAA